MNIANNSKFAEIERLTRHYASEKATLSERVEDMKVEMNAVARRLTPGIKSAVGRVAAAYDALKAALEGVPDLFVKPRTVTYEGYKVGYTKTRDGLDWDEDAQVIQLIRKKLPEELHDVLIVTKESLSLESLKTLTAEQLAKIGVRIVPGQDAVVIKSADAAVDKAVNSMLKEAEELAYAERKEAA